MWPPLTSLAHRLHCRLATCEKPEDVGLEHLPPMLGVGDRDRLRIADAGVVDHDVEPAGRRRCVRDECRDLFGHPDVHHVCLCGSARRDDALDRCLHRGGAASRQDHMGALGTECLCDGATDPARSAGDDRGAARRVSGCRRTCPHPVAVTSVTSAPGVWIDVGAA